MPTVSSIFCTRCGSSTPFAGLPDERRRVQSARCPPCTTAVRRGEDKWITRNGETRHCASCGIGFPARSKYARCQPCRTQDQTTLPALFTISSTPRVCDTCSNVLPQYEQSRRVCHRCRRRQVSQRSTANTPLPTPIETPLPMLIHAPSSPFRPIVPSPSSRPPATPMTPGCQTFPSPRTGTPGTPVPPPTLRCCNSCGVRLPLSLQRYRFCGPCRAVNQRVRRRAGVPRGFQSSLEIPDALDIGDLVVECCKCHALFFKNEVQVTIDGIEKCCMRGAIFDELDPLSLPGTVSDDIKRLFSTNDTDAVHFRKHIMQLNQALTFTSVSATRDSRLSRSEAVLTYSIEGTNRHFSGPLRGIVDIFSRLPMIPTNILPR